MIRRARIQKTTLAKKETTQAGWYEVSAREKTLGRLATQVAMVLMGKHKPMYTPHVDTGDFVIVTDAAAVTLTGDKWQTKYYDYYTNHSGGHKYVSYKDLREAKPEKVITDAVRRMLPKNKLGRKMLTKLKVYRESSHPHVSQMPHKLESVIKV